jgi:MerR family transcriptional regulator, light-induced transcriptional regulator
MEQSDDTVEDPVAGDDVLAETGTAAVFARVADALDAHDKPTAVRTAVEAVTSGYITIPELYRDVLTSILAATGAAWQRGTLAIWEEHLASATVRTIVEILYPGVLKAKAEAPDAGRSVLLACPPEESHDLGLRMVTDRFDMAGWTTYFLGPDTPVEEIADAAGRLGVHAIVMSSSTHFHRLAVRHAVDYLKHVLPNVDVWVGGPAFVGAVTGWLPQEIVDLDELLGDQAPREDVAMAGQDADLASEATEETGEEAAKDGNAPAAGEAAPEAPEGAVPGDAAADEPVAED